MPRFSANLGFLWTELALPDAIRAAAAAGFDAVECHWPYQFDPGAVRAALDDTGLTMLGLNTVRGAAGENGLAALPGREAEARQAIGQALDYARQIGCGAVHVMAGFAHGPLAESVFAANLGFACDLAEQQGATILIEPLNRHDAPGYFLSNADHAAAIIERLGRDNLRLMFDCYHLQIMQGDLTRLLGRMAAITGHIQFAGVPDRGPPDRGEVNYRHIFDHLDSMGWEMPLGAEYKPGGPTGPTLGWMKSLR
ncbi:hydroxypyruvate isomerase [Paracoccus halophilus]|uniref:Isomerase n=1 Tax=Paracoccus halophilus TaxID=376733 RepID=A0A099F7Z3_9RHOB|nr:TIM barrel protein [Paracoccus halophilus]KGJ06348.1 isomerase [Paracoccus halophilus]SFA38939.1 hydroxypyruvate isomerase [Paracoccus halophilus]